MIVGNEKRLERLDQVGSCSRRWCVTLEHVNILGNVKCMAASLALPLESARDLSISKDVFFTDITEADYARLALELGVYRLSVATSKSKFPVRGVMYGDNSRMFLPLVVTKRSIHLHVLFLYNNSSPSTCLRQDTLEALGYDDQVLDRADVLIHGVRVTVRASKHVDLLGQDFFEKIGARVTASYKDGTFMIEKQFP